MSEASTHSTWSNRRRLLAALNCQVPDRVPISTYGLVGYNTRAWENRQESLRPLMDRIRRDTDCIAMWEPGCNGRFLESAHPVVMRHEKSTAGTMTIHHHRLQTPAGELTCIVQTDPNVNTHWVTEHWCKSTDDVDRALSVPFEPMDFDPADLPRITAEVGDRGIIMSSLGDPAYLAAELMKFQDFTLWAYEYPEHFARTVETIAERVMENLQRRLKTHTVDLYRIYGPEYFTPPFFPPEFFDRFVVPHVRAMTEMIHAAGSKVRLHCHGRIGQVLELFFKTGVDGTDPCEPPPDGDMELDEVKRRCADHNVSVFGNIEFHLLENGTPETVRAAVARAMEQAKAGGGFVLMPTAEPIQAPITTRTEENYHAYIEAGLEFGRYRQ